MTRANAAMTEMISAFNRKATSTGKQVQTQGKMRLNLNKSGIMQRRGKGTGTNSTEPTGKVKHRKMLE